MISALKISMLTTFFILFVFGSSVWTKPISLDNKKGVYDASISGEHLTYTALARTYSDDSPAGTFTHLDAGYPRKIEPSLLFLFGTGIIGFGIVAKRRI